MSDSTEGQEAGQPGLRQQTAFALAALGTVRRRTLRALLPAGEMKRRGPVAKERWHLGERKSLVKNKTTVAFGRALQEFEQQGWIDRTPDVIVVRDRRALAAFAHSPEPAVTPDLLDVRGAIKAARDDLRQIRETANRDELAQRHNEIEGLLHLLAAAGRPTALTTI